MAAANPMANKLPMFVIGKATNPWCFKNVKFLPCFYRNQQKSWMDGKLFEEWLRGLDRKFFWKKKCCFCDMQLPSPSPHWQPKSNQVVFPSCISNTTSKTKPMHRGVIYSLKAKYCMNVVRNFMQSVEKKKTLPKILLLQVMQMLASARNVLLMQRIVNCFQKSGISTKS